MHFVFMFKCVYVCVCLYIHVCFEANQFYNAEHKLLLRCLKAIVIERTFMPIQELELNVSALGENVFFPLKKLLILQNCVIIEIFLDLFI